MRYHYSYENQPPLGMIRLFFILPFLGLYCIGYSQIKSGKIVDEDGKPIAYALVNPINGYDIFTDEQGLFSINQDFDFRKVDSVKVTALGFLSKKVTFPEREKTIILKRKKIPSQSPLPSSSQTETFGFSEKIKPRKISTQRISVTAVGNQVGRFIDNPKNTSGKIEEIILGVGPKGKYNAPFRLRIFSVDAEGKPQKDLLLKNVITRSKNRKGGRVRIDVSAHHLPFPPEGVFVAMEWLHTDLKQYYYSTKWRHKYKGKIFKGPRHSYGQQLLIYRLSKPKKYWMCRPVWGDSNGWRNFDWYYDPIIQLKASFNE